MKGTDTLQIDDVFTRKEYIERDAFITRQRELYCQNCDRRRGMKDGKLTKRFVYPIGGAPCRACDVDDTINAVEYYPAADVVPVRHGKWIKVDDGIYYHMECSLCHERPLRSKWVDDNELSPYCPTCGARMDKDGDGE